MFRQIISCLFTFIVLVTVASCSNNNKGETDSTEVDPISFTDEGLPGAIYRISGADISLEDEPLSVKQVGGRELLFEEQGNNIWQARIPVDWWGESLQFELNDSTGKTLANYKVDTAEHPTLTNFSGGSNHSCVLADGLPVCWGANEVHQYDVVARSLNPVAVSALNNITCIQSSNDEIDCSGIQDQYLDLNYESAQQVAPASYQHIANLETLASGNYHNVSSMVTHYSSPFKNYLYQGDILNTYFLCSIEQGELICGGQSEDTYREYLSEVIPIEPHDIREEEVFDWSMLNGFVGSEISAFAAGSHALCMLVDGEVLCKGLGSKPLPSESFGEEFVSLPLAGLVPPAFTSPTMLAMRGSNACVVDQNSTQCWSVETGESISVPAHISSPASISVGSQHYCALVDGKPNCWGNFCIYSEYHELDGGYSDFSCFDDEDVDPPNDTETFLELISGEAYSCGLTAAGAVECWGKYCELPEDDSNFPFGIVERKCVAASSLTPDLKLIGVRMSEIGNQNISKDTELTVTVYGLSDPVYSAQSSSTQIVGAVIDATSGKLTLKVGELTGRAHVTVQATSGRLSLEIQFRVNVVAAQ